MISNTAFWLDGVAKTLVAVLGVASNILAGYVLCKPNMKNSFNLCLVALAVIDTIFLLGSILQSIRKRYVNNILRGNLFMMEKKFSSQWQFLRTAVSSLCLLLFVVVVVCQRNFLEFFEEHCAFFGGSFRRSLKVFFEGSVEGFVDGLV